MVSDEQHLNVRQRIAAHEHALGPAVHIAGDERIKVARRAEDRQPQLVFSALAHRRIERQRRLADGGLRFLRHIADLHAVALREREHLGLFAVLLRNVGKVERIDADTGKQQRQTVGVVGMVVREHHRVEPPYPCAEKIVRGDIARTDVGIAAAAVHEHAMTPGEQRNALALSDIERRDMQAPALKLQRVEARCRKEHRHRQRAGDPPAVPPPPRDSTDGKECIDIHKPQHGERGVKIERVERQPLQQSRNKKHIPHAERHERHKGRADRRDGHAQQQSEQTRAEDKAHHPQAQEVTQK